MITGGPTAGKETLAKALAGEAISRRATDDLIPLGWGPDSDAAALWLSEPGPWIIHGVAMGRALKKWLDANHIGTPADVVVYLDSPTIERTAGQHVMASGCNTIFAPVEQRLLERGVHVIRI